MQLLHKEIYPGFEGERFAIKIFSEGDERLVYVDLVYTLNNVPHEANLINYKTAEADLEVLKEAAQKIITDIEIVKRT